MASDLDFSQIIQRAYDETENRLRVDSQLTTSIIAPPGLEVAIAAVDDNIAIRNSNNSNELLINSDGSINAKQSGIFTAGRTWNLLNTTDSVNIGNFPATQVVSGSVSVSNFPATQSVIQSTSPWVISGTVTANAGTNLNTSALALDSTLSSLNSKVVTVDTSNVTVISSVLPTGASTSANQTTANSSLSSIDSKLIDFNTTPVQTIQLFTKPYDSIAVTYPTTTQEIYQSYVGGLSGTLQQTITINYTDTTKNFILNVVRT